MTTERINPWALCVWQEIYLPTMPPVLLQYLYGSFSHAE